MASVFKLHINEISYNPTDQNWSVGQTSNDFCDYNEIQVNGVSFSINIGRRNLFEKVHLSAETKKSKIGSDLVLTEKKKHTQKSKYFSDEREFFEVECKKLRSQDSYLLFPVDINIRLKTETKIQKQTNPIQINSLFIETKEPIMFVINNTNLKFISAFADHLELINIVRKNIHLRPMEPPKEKPQAWWLYAISAVKEERKRLTTIIKSSAKNLLNMRKYIDLYKRKQTLVSLQIVFDNIDSCSVDV